MRDLHILLRWLLGVPLVALVACVQASGVDLTLELDARIGAGGQAGGLWSVAIDPEAASNVSSIAFVAHGPFVDAGGTVEGFPESLTLDAQTPSAGAKFALLSPDGQAGGAYDVTIDAVLGINPSVVLDSETATLEIVPFALALSESTPITWNGTAISGAITIELDAPTLSEVDVGINYLVQPVGTGAVISDFSVNANTSPPLASGTHVIPVDLPADDPSALPSGPHELRIVVTALSVRRELLVSLSF